jgi:hypothetical protein
MQLDRCGRRCASPAYGDLQGGVVGALVESLASCVAWLAVRCERKLVMGLSGRRSGV